MTDARHSRWITAALLAPAGVIFVFLLILPLVVVLVYSFGVRGPAGGYEAAFTFVKGSGVPRGGEPGFEQGSLAILVEVGFIARDGLGEIAAET